MGKKKSIQNRVAPKAEHKRERVLALLRCSGGASLSEITEATGWLPHSARAVLTGFRKRGLGIDKARVDGTTRWSITAEPSA
jgi:hypothetical protein